MLLVVVFVCLVVGWNPGHGSLVVRVVDAIVLGFPGAVLAEMSFLAALEASDLGFHSGLDDQFGSFTVVAAAVMAVFASGKSLSGEISLAALFVLLAIENSLGDQVVEVDLVKGVLHGV